MFVCVCVYVCVCVCVRERERERDEVKNLKGDRNRDRILDTAQVDKQTS